MSGALDRDIGGCGNKGCNCASTPARPGLQLKLLGNLIDYPADELWEQADALREAIREVGFEPVVRCQVKDFVKNLLALDPMEAQARWVETFDRGRSLSLLMFEHIHGESRDRGQAMADLLDTYQRNGFQITAQELPDYLPLLLEYLSQRNEAEGREWLHHLSHILGLLAARAKERGSPYAPLFELLIKHAGDPVDLAVFQRRVANEEHDNTPEAMDKVWEEEAIRFGAQAPDDNCKPTSRVPSAVGSGPGT